MGVDVVHDSKTVSSGSLPVSPSASQNQELACSSSLPCPKQFCFTRTCSYKCREVSLRDSIFHKTNYHQRQRIYISEAGQVHFYHPVTPSAVYRQFHFLKNFISFKRGAYFDLKTILEPFLERVGIFQVT